MKSNIDKVYSKLPKKVNLKKQKIELNVAFDLASISSAVNVWKKNIDIDIEELEKLTKELEDVKLGFQRDIAELAEEAYRLENKLLNAEKMAKELGVDPSAINNFDDALEIYNSAILIVENSERILNKL
jgi:tetratricopeptide (TPR) repeat protein